MRLAKLKAVAEQTLLLMERSQDSLLSLALLLEMEGYQTRVVPRPDLNGLGPGDSTLIITDQVPGPWLEQVRAEQCLLVLADADWSGENCNPNRILMDQPVDPGQLLDRVGAMLRGAG